MVPSDNGAGILITTRYMYSIKGQFRIRKIAICSGFIVRFTPDFATRMVRKIHGDVVPKMLQYRKYLQNSSPVEKIK